MLRCMEVVIVLDLVMQGLVLSTAVLSLVAGSRWGVGWRVPPGLIVLGLLGCYLALGVGLVGSRIHADSRLWLLAGSAFFFFVFVAVLSVRRGRVVADFARAGVCVMSVGVVWGMRLLASDSLSWARTAVSMVVVAVLVLSALLLPGLRNLLERSPSWLLGGFGVLLVGLPLLTWGRVNGAFIQFHVPFVGKVQPGELGRILLVLWLARSVAHQRPRLVLGGWQSWSEGLGLLWRITAPVIVGVGVGVLSNDLGPALVLTVTAAVMVFIGGLGWGMLAAVLAVGAAGVGLVVAVSGKVAHRLEILGDPLALATGGGLEQVGLGLAAMAHGPTGIGLGVPNQVPEWDTDMLVASIGHELGISHVIVVLLATAAAAVACWQMVARVPDERRQLAIAGLGVVLGIQTLLMISAMFSVSPLTGMPVPWLSLSGSSMLSSAFAFAVILAMGSGLESERVTTPLTSRTLVWVSLVVLVCLLLIVKAVSLELGAAKLIESIRGRDPIGARLSKSHAVTLTTRDGVRIAGPVSSDGKPLRPANTEREYPYERYATILGSPGMPGLDQLAGIDGACGGGNCPPVSTTLVDRVQRAAWDGLQGRTGSVAAVDLETGDVLAYVSTEDGESWGKQDRVRGLTTAPGSVAKIVTGAAAVAAGVDLDLARTSQYRSISSYNRQPCGGTLTKALAESCNPYFGQLGDEIGGERLATLSSDWIGGQSDLNGLPIAPSKLVDPAADETLVAMGAIGLGNAQVTPLGMLGVTAQIARDGEPICMRVIAGGQALCGAQATMSAQAAAAVAAGMRETVLSGTARAVPGIQDLQAAAKTGTADFDGALHNATFVTFAPIDSPKVAVVVFVEPGSDGVTGLTGSLDAGPIAVSVLQAALGQ